MNVVQFFLVVNIKIEDLVQIVAQVFVVVNVTKDNVVIDIGRGGFGVDNNSADVFCSPDEVWRECFYFDNIVPGKGTGIDNKGVRRFKTDYSAVGDIGNTL